MAPWDGAEEISTIMTVLRAKIKRYRITHPSFVESAWDNPEILPAQAAHLPGAAPKLQARLTKILHEMSFSALSDSASETLRARLLSHAEPDSSALLDAIPSCEGLRVSNEVMSHFLRNYECIPEFDPCANPRCTCALRPEDPPTGRPVEQHHADHCPLGGGTTDRHDALANTLADCFREARFVTHKNFHASGPGEQPDLKVFGFPGPSDTAYVEVAFVNPLRNASLKKAAQTPLAAAREKEHEKTRKYTPLAESENCHLIPAVMESTGAFGPNLQRILKMCANNINLPHFLESVDNRTWASASFKQFWSQRLAIAFAQGHFQMFLAQTKRARDQSSFAPPAAGDIPPVPRHIPRPLPPPGARFPTFFAPSRPMPTPESLFPSRNTYNAPSSPLPPRADYNIPSSPPSPPHQAQTPASSPGGLPSPSPSPMKC